MNFNYRIVNILHTGHHGEKGTEKVGAKYEDRKGRRCIINKDEFTVGRSLLIWLENEDFCGSRQNLFTTPFVSYTEDGNFAYLETLNSIYKLEILSKEDENDEKEDFC